MASDAIANRRQSEMPPKASHEEIEARKEELNKSKKD